MIASGFLIAQARPATASPVPVYTAPIRTEVGRMVVANTTGATATFSLYHDDSGTQPLDQSTALYWNNSVPPNSTKIIDLKSEGGGVYLSVGGRIAVQSATPNALTFSLYGTTSEAR